MRDKDVIIGTIIMGIIVLSAIAVVVLLLISDDPFGQMAKSITLERQNIYEEIIIGKEKEVKLTATTKNITDNLVWSSSDEKIATVNSDGKTATITLKAEGSATITVKAGKLTSECKIVVKEVESRMTIMPNEIVESIVKENIKVITLIAELENFAGDVEWTVNNQRVATIKGNGMTAELTLKEVGEAIVIAKAGEKIATCNVKVNEEQSMITLNTTYINKEIVKGSSEEHTLEVSLINTTGELNWTSSNTKVVTVEKLDETKAKVTLVGEGSATITVSDGNIKTACNIKVTYPEPSIIIKQNNKNVTNQTIYKEVKKGSLETIVLVPELNNISGDITWKSSNEKIATIIKSGTTAKVVLKSVGTATITATVDGKTAECSITVTEKQK